MTVLSRRYWNLQWYEGLYLGREASSTRPRASSTYRSPQRLSDFLRWGSPMRRQPQAQISGFKLIMDARQLGRTGYDGHFPEGRNRKYLARFACRSARLVGIEFCIWLAEKNLDHKLVVFADDDVSKRDKGWVDRTSPFGGTYRSSCFSSLSPSLFSPLFSSPFSYFSRT